MGKSSNIEKESRFLCKLLLISTKVEFSSSKATEVSAAL